MPIMYTSMLPIIACYYPLILVFPFLSNIPCAEFIVYGLPLVLSFILEVKKM